MPFKPGEILAGKYKVIDLVGTGGVAFVVSARHVGLDEVVALKFLRPEFTTHDEAVRRFTVEARCNFKLKSPHVVRVLDVETLADGTPFIIMELLEGTDLGHVVETRGPLPVELAVDYVRQACEGLATAHAAYVVHRDIKPDNLFLTKTEQGADQIKLLDFGISKVPRVGAMLDCAQTSAVTILGSPPYMSPEQVRASSEIDARTDIWSMGCVLYELLSGSAPFERPSVTETCAAILQDNAAPLRSVCPHVSPELEAAVMRCLDKDPDQRFQDVAELASALAALAPEAATATARESDPFVTGMRPVLAPSASARDDAATVHGFRKVQRAALLNRLLIAAVVGSVLIAAYVGVRSSHAAEDAPVGEQASTRAATVQSVVATAPLAPAPAPAAASPVGANVAAPIEGASIVAPAAPAEVAAPVVAPARVKLRAKSKPILRRPNAAPTDPDVGF